MVRIGFGPYGPFAAAVLAASMWASPCVAEGALALGVPANVAKEGFSYGTAYNRATAEEARAVALENCKTNQDGSKKSQALCQVLDTFRNKCVTIAMDPEAGTPGVGWAIAAGGAASDKQALANCVATAGPTRGDACKVTTRRCDGVGTAPRGRRLRFFGL
jgi:hypothetical protein